MTFWQRRVDEETLKVVSQWMGLEVDPLTDLPFNATQEGLRGLARQVETMIDTDLPLFCWVKWLTVGDVQKSARVAVMRVKMRQAA